MRNPSGIRVVGRRVLQLPALDQDSGLPWPSFAVDMQERKDIGANLTPFTYALSALPPDANTGPGTTPTSFPAPTRIPPKRDAVLSANPLRQPTPPAHDSGTLPPPPKPIRRSGPIPPPVVAPTAPQYQPPRAPAIPAVPRAPVFPATRNATDSSAAEWARFAYICGWSAILLGLIAGIPAIIYGHMALQRASQNSTPEAVTRDARIGLILGYVLSFLSLAIIAILIIRARG